MNKKLKIILISTISAIVAVAILVGALWYFGNAGDPVQVLPVGYCSTDGYGMGSQYDGTVTSDNLQAIYPSSTQTVTEIFVTEGQQVKTGDKLLSYDTTLTDIQLERQRIGVQQAELDLENAKKDLAEINAMLPYSPPPETQPTTQKPTQPLTPVEELPYDLGGEGTQDQPHRWLWTERMTFDNEFIDAELADKNEVWISFEIREQNAVNGALLDCWGLHVIKLPAEDETPAQYKYRFFDPYLVDTEEPAEEEEETYWQDNSSGYTSAEIAQMRKEKEKEIRDLDVQYRLAQVELERMTKEAENGIVYATVDGVVTALTDAETALSENTPLMIVSGGGCFYVQVPLGEYDCESFAVGTPVEVMSWMSGAQVTGTLESISDLPTSGYYYGSGNPNVTLYGALVAVDASAGLQEGEYVSVSIGTPEDQSGTLYLENMYIRTENGSSYVYKRGEDGTLVKTTVTLGSSLWGSYTAVYGDISETDWIAFPYGKDVKEGAKTVESSFDSFYG